MRKRLLISVAAVAVIAITAAFWFLRITDADEPPAKAAVLSFSPAKPVTGDPITISAQFPSNFEREAKLQIQGENGWRTAGTRDSSDSGKVRFKTTMPSTEVQIRVVAIETVHGRKRYDARTTRALTVTPEPVTTKLTVLPPIAQTTKKTDLTPVVAKISPARPGRALTLQRSSDGKAWTDVSTTKQSSKGKASFTATKVAANTLFRIASGENNADVSQVAKPIYPRMTFDSDFDGTTLNRDAATGWHHRYVGILSINMGRICSESSPQSVSVAGGSLLLQTLQTASKSTPECATELTERYKKVKKPVGTASGRIMTNGHVSTITAENPGGFQFKYGIASARIKFAKNRGQHGSFWMQPGDQQPGTEIDIVEYFGDGYSRGGLTHAIHYKKNGVAQVAGTLPKVGDLSWVHGNDNWWKDYHVYSVEWTPTEYIFRIDGKETWRTSDGITQRPAYLILSLLTSDWELPSLPRGDAKGNRMAVDWVKVWQTQ